MSKIRHSKKLDSLYQKGVGDIFDAFMTVADHCYASYTHNSNERDVEAFEAGLRAMESLKPGENLYWVEAGEYVLYFKAKAVKDVISQIKAQRSYCEKV